MLQLRLTQHDAGPGRHRVEIAVEGDGPRRAADATFDFALAPADEEDLRWYFEEYLLHPHEPERVVARIESRIAAIGEELFRKVFEANDDARDRWAEVRRGLAKARIEIVTSLDGASAIPWELLRDPRLGKPLALRARSFVRTHPAPTLPPRPAAGKRGKVRILLVICRPGGAKDVGFRSVAGRLLRGLSAANREAFDLDVLRPPTFERLGEVLHQASEAGHPYDVVHFDGHGGYFDLDKIAKTVAGRPEAEVDRMLREAFDVPDDRFSQETFRLDLRDLYPRATRPGLHSYVVFENPILGVNQRLVDGPELARLLVETGVSTLVLNACRSAYAESTDTEEAGKDTQPSPATSEGAVQARSWSTLAQEVMDAGLPAVVAMRYNVWVVTAAQFVADLYGALADGEAVGEAVTRGRKKLDHSPQREIAYDPVPLQDWSVPVVYEAAPIRIFPKRRRRDEALKLEVKEGASVETAGNLDPALPTSPDTGFFGRDETLLALDRAFDRDAVVLLHAWAGSGKTATAAEFARWYQGTGGVRGPVLFSTFERYLPLPRLLDRIGQLFGPALEANGIHWLTLDDGKRRATALAVLQQIPVLWIWDNVEPVAGFPAGTDSAWTAAEQAELLAFLRDLRQTQAKVLLTSRRDERPWLGHLPTRVQIPSLQEAESLQLVRSLAAKHGRRLADVEDWRPLLTFAQGNPMTLTVLAGEALRQGWTARDQVERYVARLRAGEAAFPDESAEGRSRSLGASLAYGFEHAFREEERKVLALLHLFQGFVDVDALCWMGNPDEGWCLPEVRGLTREVGIALLDRAAEVGHLTRVAEGYYTIHPALPWFFQSLFERTYSEGGEAAVRAYVEAEAALGDYYIRQFNEGHRDVITVLRLEEANLLNARRLAMAHGWHEAVIRTMQGLVSLYDHTGRRAEWKRLVEEIVPDFVDPKTDGPLSNTEEHWSLLTQYRVQLAQQEARWTEAERLQQLRATWDQARAAPHLDRPVDSLTSYERNEIRSLAASLHDLAQIRREFGRVDCVPAYEEALALAEQIGDRVAAATCAFSLGHAYKDLQGLRNLDQAERWYQKSLDLRAEQDNLGRVRCRAQLGNVAHQRFLDARAASRPTEELLLHLNQAAQLYHEVLRLLPPDAASELCVTHDALGLIYGDAGDLDRALFHYRQSIFWAEKSGDSYGAAQTCGNVAFVLFRFDRRDDAVEYAEAALRGFESASAGAANDAEKVRRLIAEIRGK